MFLFTGVCLSVPRGVVRGVGTANPGPAVKNMSTIVLLLYFLFVDIPTNVQSTVQDLRDKSIQAERVESIAVLPHDVRSNLSCTTRKTTFFVMEKKAGIALPYRDAQHIYPLSNCGDVDVLPSSMYANCVYTQGGARTAISDTYCMYRHWKKTCRREYFIVLKNDLESRGCKVVIPSVLAMTGYTTTPVQETRRRASQLNSYTVVFV